MPEPSPDTEGNRATSEEDVGLEELRRTLNDQQVEAVIHKTGPLLILAGAGSGKTRVITHRIARLISCGVSPYRIIALTFTNKAAAEMKARTMALLGQRDINIWISTFHSACLRILRRHADLIGYPKDFTVCDTLDQTKIIKTCLKELGIEEKRHPAREILSLISRFKNKMQGPADAEKELNPRRFEDFLRCFYLYEEKLTQSRLMDFDDLLGKTIELMTKEERIREQYRERFLHILVDEFQDTNVAQYKLIRLILGEHNNICVVGDDDQSIYMWRGAQINNILNFEQDFPNTKVALLEKNYRSTQNILKAAQAVVERNPHRNKKTLFTDNDHGEKIVLYRAADEMDEALRIVHTIKKLVRGNGEKLNNFALFYRTNSQSRALEDALRDAGLPYQIFGGLKFYARKEIKDILAYFRVAVNPRDAVSFKRIINIPPRGIGATTFEKLENFAKEQAQGESVILPEALDRLDLITSINSGTKKRLENFRTILDKVRSSAKNLDPADAIEQALDITGYMSWLSEDKNSESLARTENLTELVSAAQEYEERNPDDSMVEFLNQTTLVADADDDNLNEQAVKLMTVHVSKGLEFPVVFITGLEENLFPHARSKDDPKQLQEERRLMYVAMTRAMKRLYLSYAKRRRIFGVFQTNDPSGFLLDIPSETLEKQVCAQSTFTGRSVAPSKRYKSKPRVAPIVESASSATMSGDFAVGMNVTHPFFEIGVIKKIKGKGGSSILTVYFPLFGEKKLVRKFAKLKVARKR